MDALSGLTGVTDGSGLRKYESREYGRRAFAVPVVVPLEEDVPADEVAVCVEEAGALLVADADADDDPAAVELADALAAARLAAARWAARRFRSS
jgi:hypothetical protein